MNAEQNKQTLETGYQMWAGTKASKEATKYWFDLLADNVCWRSNVDERTPGMEFAVDCQSKDAVIQYFHRLSELWELESYTLEDAIAEDCQVVVIGTASWKNRKTGKSVEIRKADVFKMENGKITEFCEFFDTAKANAASV